jgi:hypothetical protein
MAIQLIVGQGVTHNRIFLRKCARWSNIPGLHPENRNKGSEKPTAERVLKAFSKVTLTILKDTAGREVGRWLTPLSSVQQEILRRLGFVASLYQQLEILNTRK